VNGRLLLAESLGGYMETEPGRFHAFYLVVNGASARNIDDVLRVVNDESDIAAILQEDGARLEDTTSQDDEQ
jgi:serine-type D-Ala-D-Ala carboxypeptidase/endopeptidase (penicillin-binding protein 4)